MKIILDVSVVEKRNRVSVVLITVNCFCQKETRFLNLKKKPGFCGGEKKPGFSWRKETGFLVEKRNRVSVVQKTVNGCCQKETRFLNPQKETRFLNPQK